MRFESVDAVLLQAHVTPTVMTSVDQVVHTGRLQSSSAQRGSCIFFQGLLQLSSLCCLLIGERQNSPVTTTSVGRTAVQVSRGCASEVFVVERKEILEVLSLTRQQTGRP